MTSPATTCPACGAPAAGNFCAACGASLATRSCSGCHSELSPRARFCHRCGRPVAAAGRAGSERRAWIVAGILCVVLVGGIVYRVSSSALQPKAPDMANAGVESGLPQGATRAPDISGMSPRERFDRLFNRIMQAAEAGDSIQVQQFTPMALGAYQQLGSRDADARYHAAVLYLQVGDLAPARALADTILAVSPGHLFGYVVQGTVAQIAGDSAGLNRARLRFLEHYPAEMRSNRTEYQDHRPVLEEFRREAERAATSPPL
jgi:Double zinc ribbon